MRKRKILLTTSILAILSLTACVSKDVKSNIAEDTVQEIVEDKEVASKDNTVEDEVEFVESKSLVENSTTEFDFRCDSVLVLEEYIVGNFANTDDLQYNYLDMYSSNSIEFAYLMQNKSGLDREFEASIYAVDKDGNDVEYEDVSTHYAVKNEEQFVLSGQVALDQEQIGLVDHLVVQIYSDSHDDISISEHIAYEATQRSGQYGTTYLNVDVTNNSNQVADNIDVVLIGFDPKGNVSDIETKGWSYVYDHNEEDTPIQPNATGTLEFSMYSKDEESGSYDDDAQHWIYNEMFKDYKIFVFGSTKQE